MRVEPLEARALLAVLTVTSGVDGDAGSLRDRIAQSDPGDTIRFAPTLRGATLALTEGELAITHPLTIQGSGQTLDADGLSRVLHIENVPGRVTLSDLTITDGLAPETVDNGYAGGGIYIAAADVTLRGVRVVNNWAIGQASGDPSAAFTLPGQGAGVFVIDSQLRLDHSEFRGNRAVGGDNTLDQQAGGGFGGGLAALNSTLIVNGGRFEGNQARGGDAVNPMQAFPTSFGGAAEGGALYLLQTDATLTGVTMRGNAAIGGKGLDGVLAEYPGSGQNGPQPGGGGNGSGGALFAMGLGTDAPSPTLTLRNVTLTGNLAQGGSAGAPRDNTQPAQQGGSATGGALCHVENTTLVIQNATLDGNRALGGGAGPNAAQAESDTGTGGVAFGGGIFTDSPADVVVSGLTLRNSLARGGTGANSAPGIGTEAGEGGYAYGGGWFLRNDTGGLDPSQTALPTATIRRSTFQNNTAAGGAPGQGPEPADNLGAGGLGQGGGLSVVAQFDITLIGNQFLNNQALSRDGKTASAGGLAITNGSDKSRAIIQGGVFRGNRAVGGDNPAFEEFRASSADGGAILNNAPGTVISGVNFQNNVAQGGADTGSGHVGSGRGGAISSILPATGARLEVLASTFQGNRALGGVILSGNGLIEAGAGEARGGAIYNDVGALRVTGGAFNANLAQASQRGNGHNAYGGAIFNNPVESPPGFDYKAIVTLANVAFTGNTAVAFNTSLAAGGAIAHWGTSLNDSGSTFRRNVARNIGGGRALGGALWIVRPARLTGARIIDNAAEARRASPGGPIGQAFGGGIAVETPTALQLIQTRVERNRATTADPNIYRPQIN